MKYQAYQINIIAEKVLEEDLIAMLEDAGAKGYSIFEAGGNSSLHLHPTLHASIIDALHLMKIEVIVKDLQKAEQIAERITQEFFDTQPGIVSLSNVWIFRPQKF